MASIRCFCDSLTRDSDEKPCTEAEYEWLFYREGEPDLFWVPLCERCVAEWRAHEKQLKTNDGVTYRVRRLTPDRARLYA